jgi:uncharacterized membrane protein
VVAMKADYSLVSGVVFGLVAILQAMRALLGWAVHIGPVTVPLSFSWIAAMVAGALSVWAFKSRFR